MTNSGPDQTVIPTWCCYYLQRLYSHSHRALCFIANQMAFQFTIFYVEVPCFGWNKTWWSHDYSTFMCLLYQFMFLMIHIKVSLTNNLRMITQRLVIEMVFSFSQASASFSRPSMFSWATLNPIQKELPLFHVILSTTYIQKYSFSLQIQHLSSRTNI